MKLKIAVIFLVLSFNATSALANGSKDAVLRTMHGMWEQARAANIAGMFASAPDDHTYIMGGNPLWSKEETVELYATAFEGVASQEITNLREEVTMLSENAAFYMADATYAQYDADGNKLVSGPYAITVVLEKRDGKWMNIHTHQSFPVSQ